MIREAIEKIKWNIDIQEKCKKVSHANTEAIDRDIAKYQLAIEALEKQIPKKLNRICGALGEKYECPNCGSPLRDADAFVGYCKWCGQRVEV